MHNSGQKAKLPARGLKRQSKPNKSLKSTTKQTKRSLTTKSKLASPTTTQQLSFTPSKSILSTPLSSFSTTSFQLTTPKQQLFKPMKLQKSQMRFLSTSDPFQGQPPPAAAVQQRPAAVGYRPSQHAPVNPFAKQLNQNRPPIDQQQQHQQQQSQFQEGGADDDKPLTPEEEAQLDLEDEESFDSSISCHDESQTSSEINYDTTDDQAALELSQSEELWKPKYRVTQPVSDLDEISDDPNVNKALNLGMEPPPRPDPTHFRRRRTHGLSESESELMTEINTDNAPDYPQRIKPRSSATVTKRDHRGMLHDSEMDAHQLYSDGAIFQSDGSLSEYENQFYSETDIDWDSFETLGILDEMQHAKNATKLGDVWYQDQFHRARVGSTKLNLPRLKPGAKIPKGWMNRMGIG
jgi:hypothetical protein